MKQIKTIVVLGMHRSGTSMTSGILSRLGVDIGKRLAPPNFANPLGYFEDKDFFELNNIILRRAGGDWKSPPDRDAILAQKNKLQKRIHDMVKRKESELWGWKDPRTNLTIELYLPFLTNPYFIICNRNPIGVAKSLAERENWKVEDCIKLIEIYKERINNLFYRFNNLQKLDINYENIVTNPEKEIDSIINFLGIKVSQEQYQEALKIILTPKDIQVLRNKQPLSKKKEIQSKDNFTLLWRDE